MFNRRILVISMLFAGCTFAANGFAQDAQRGAGAHGKPREAGGSGQRSQVRMLYRLDSNGDKLISLEEFTAKGTANHERLFSRADRDEDGFVSADEARPRRRGRGPAEDIDTDALRECIAGNGGLAEVEEDRFAGADKDGDGALSQEEFFMQLEQRAFDQFARMDTDADAQLTGAELAVSMQGRNEQRLITRQCLAEQVDPFL